MNLKQSPLALQDVVINSELVNRPSKAPDYKAENQALMALAQTLADTPGKILQRLAETALQLCRADSAGIGLFERQDGVEVFRWKALAGVLSDRLNATMPRDGSLCGLTIDRNATQLMYMPERVFPALKSEPPVVEALVLPFHVHNEPVGAIWIVAHDERRKFDREDERSIKSLAQFASAYWQTWQARAGAEAAAQNERRQTRGLAAANSALQARLKNIAKAEEELRGLNRELQARIEESAAELTSVNATEIGRFGARIAHDFNNILNIIQAYAALIMADSAKPKNVVKHTEVIRRTVQEGVALARQLFGVGRKGEPRLNLADINDVLRRTTQSLSPMFPTTTGIATDLDPHLPMIMIDAGLIYQAILNLCINARDAMPDGGEILVRSRTTSGDRLREIFPEATAEHYVHISVADGGVGMEADVRSRVFESYFTTKKPGQGTGLGLSIVHGIVTEHAGFIEVASEPDCGSTFHIYLPVPGDKATANDAALNKTQDRSWQRETVLYAEDDARLTGLMQRLLESEGFEVLTAQNGMEAVEVHSRHKNRIGLAILDFGLAKLNGWEAFQLMKKINPRLKGILASGHVSREAESRVTKGELNGVLQKPYLCDEVLALIKQTIKSR